MDSTSDEKLTNETSETRSGAVPIGLNPSGLPLPTRASLSAMAAAAMEGSDEAGEVRWGVG